MVLGEDTGKQLAEMKVGDKCCISAANTLEFTPKHEPVYVTPWRGEQEASDTCVLTGGPSPRELPVSWVTQRGLDQAWETESNFAWPGQQGGLPPKAL